MREGEGVRQMSRTEETRDKRQQTEREASDFSEETGYRPSVNQRRHEPMPASHHDDRRQEAVVRNEEHTGAQPPQAAPSRRRRRRRG
jgi:hypothetical protein